MRKTITVLAAGFAVLTASMLGAGTAGASAVPRVALAAAYDSNYEAGQYIQSSPNIHIRDFRGAFQTNQAQLGVSQGGTSDENGGVGLQLCSPASGQAIQFGLVPDPSAAGEFEIAYAFGPLTATTPATTADACATGGILPDPNVITFASYSLIPVGDTVALEIYYDPASGWVTVSITDLAQGGTEEYHFRDSACGRFCFFTEGGAGVRDLAAPALSAPADIPLVLFYGLRATQYNGRHWTLSHWPTVAISYNPGGSATDSPGDLLQTNPLNKAGTSFMIESGNPGT